MRLHLLRIIIILFVVSTSTAAGGLPLGIVITSGESASTIHSGMRALNGLFPKCSFYGQGSPDNIMIDDSSAEREGLHKTWPNSMYISFFTKHMEVAIK